MIKLSNEQLRQLQMIELEMLIEVDRICKKCDIKYNVIAGTMLGAVRHKGFIPWDDDADVCMLRDEYEKFRVAVQTELDSTRFYFQDYRHTKGYRWGYGKIRRKNTLFLRENQDHMPYEQGVFIDIFPMDGVPDNYYLRVIHDCVCFCIRKTLWSEVGKFSDKSAINRLIFRTINLISEKSIKAILRNLEIWSNRKRTKYVRMLMFPTPNKVRGFNREWYENLTEVEFEKTPLIGFKDADDYLAFTYGNYMEFPPVEERKVHPVTEIELVDVKVG